MIIVPSEMSPISELAAVASNSLCGSFQTSDNTAAITGSGKCWYEIRVVFDARIDGPLVRTSVESSLKVVPS